MPATISHALSATTPDDPNYEIRPSHWNSVHAVTFSAAGSEIIGAFSNLNGFSFGTEPSGKITGSYTVPTQSVAPSAIVGSNATYTSGTVVFTGSNAATVRSAAGQQIVIDVPVQTVQTQNLHNITLSGNTSGALAAISSGTLTLVGGNNVTLSQAGNAVTISAASQTVQTQNLHNVTLSGNTSGALAGISSGTLTLAGGNNIILSQAGNAVTISASNQSVQTQGFLNTVSVVGNTAGNTSAGSGSIVLAGGPNITLSGATAAGGMTISVSAAAAGAGGAATLQSYWNPDTPAGSFAVSDAAMSVQPFFIGGNMTATRVMLLGHLTQSNSSTSAASSGAVSISVGLYTMSGSTASLASSGSTLLSWTTGTNSTQSTLNQYANHSGTRYRDMTVSWAMTPGNYLFGVWIRTSNAGTWTWFGNSSVSVVSHVFTSQTALYLPGFSTSSFTTAMPASVNVTNVNYVRTGASANRQPYFILMGSI